MAKKPQPMLRLARFNPSQPRTRSRREQPCLKTQQADHFLSSAEVALAIERFRSMAALMPYHAAVIAKTMDFALAEYMAANPPQPSPDDDNETSVQ